MAEIRETLRKKVEIQSLFKNGKRIGNQYVTIVYQKNGLGCNRFLFTTDKSCRTAVQRNRIKRICRALIRELSTIPEEYDIAIVGKWNLESLAFPKRVSLFESLFQRM